MLLRLAGAMKGMKTRKPMRAMRTNTKAKHKRKYMKGMKTTRTIMKATMQAKRAKKYMKATRELRARKVQKWRQIDTRGIDSIFVAAGAKIYGGMVSL